LGLALGGQRKAPFAGGADQTRVQPQRFAELGESRVWTACFEQGLAEMLVAFGGVLPLQGQAVFGDGLGVMFFGEGFVPRFAMGQILALTLHQATEPGPLPGFHLAGGSVGPLADHISRAGNDQSPQQKPLQRYARGNFRHWILCEKLGRARACGRGRLLRRAAGFVWVIRHNCPVNHISNIA